MSELIYTKEDAEALCEIARAAVAESYRQRVEALEQQLIAWKHSAVSTDALQDEIDTLTAKLTEVQGDYEAASHLAESTSKEWQATKAQQALAPGNEE